MPGFGVRGINLKLSDLNPNPKNPRTISDAKLSMLKKSLDTFGDLSGVVYNRKTKCLVGGHQRSKIFDKNTDVTITKKYPKPSKVGTVSEGYFEVKGEKFSYREVYWDETKEKAANIAANKGAGEWDLPQLSEWLKDLNNFDLDFDMDLTMFDELERSGYLLNSNFESGKVDEQPRLDTKVQVTLTCPYCEKSFER